MSVGGVSGPGGMVERPDENWSLDPSAKGERPAESPPAFDLDAGLRSASGVSLIPPPLSFLPSYDEQGSFRVSTQGESALAGLRAAAAQNTSGPEARLAAYIRGQMDDALRSIRADEARARTLPLDSPERRALEDRIDRRAARFENDVAVETLKTADEVKRLSGGDKSGFERFKAALPPYLRECVERGGVVVPGVPGAFKPRTDDGVFKGPTGVDYEVKW